MPVIGRDSPTASKRFEAVPRVPGEFVDGLGAGAMGNQTFDQLPAPHIALVGIFRAFHAEELSALQAMTSRVGSADEVWRVEWTSAHANNCPIFID